MKKLITFFGLIALLLSPVVSISQDAYSVTEVYTDQSIQTGDTIWVVGYYTSPEINFLIEFYGDWDKDEVMPPHFYLITEGVDIPEEAWHGGYILANGVVSFETNPDPDHYHEADSLIAHLDIFLLDVLIEGERISKYQWPEPDDRIFIKEKDNCDSCKFAILISGGIDTADNHSKYWENLVALYNFKVNHQEYCENNVFVHYFKGDGRDNRIPQERIFRADSSHISASFEEVARRVAKCTGEGKKATFQKMITNHGKASGSINLLNNDTLKPADLRNMQQNIIDSCCSLVYDEFLQCYGGYSVDTMKTLDAKNKAKIYANSNADHQSGYSPHNQVHPYLAKKINDLLNGKDYEDAVVDAKLAYDNYLRARIDTAHTHAQWFRNHPQAPDSEQELAYWVADSNRRAHRICTSRNVTITPMKQYCQWEKFVIPPHGQLVLKFKSDSTNHCGNVTVYQDSAGHKIKKRVWNWNVEGSYGYVAGNDQRVINGDSDATTTFWVHNDDSQFVITTEARGNTDLDESPSNEIEYPGSSFGGRDLSGDEFGQLIDPNYYFENIDRIGIDLKELPAYMGPEFVRNFTFTFNVNPEDEFWSDMELYLAVAQVLNPDTLYITCDGAENPYTELPITEPGIYTVHLGNMISGRPVSQMTLNAPLCMFEFDSWGLHSLYQPSVGTDEQPVSQTNYGNQYMSIIPNPFKQGFTVNLRLPETGRVNLSMYDVTGRKIAVVYKGEMITKHENVYFNGNTGEGKALPKGVYIIRLTLNRQNLGTTKVIKLR